MNYFMTFEAIVEELFQELEESDVNAIRNISSPDGMVIFHSSAGRTIRNNYHLWNPKNPLTSQWFKDNEAGNNTYLIDGVDHHPNHPDRVSTLILRRLWDKVNLRKKISLVTKQMCG